MARRDCQKLREIPRRIGPAPDGQKIDDLNEEPRAFFARLAHHTDELAQPGQKAVVTDTQQWFAGHVLNTGGFDDEGAGPVVREALVLVEDLRGNDTVFACAPRHYRR